MSGTEYSGMFREINTSVGTSALFDLTFKNDERSSQRFLHNDTTHVFPFVKKNEMIGH